MAMKLSEQYLSNSTVVLLCNSHQACCRYWNFPVLCVNFIHILPGTQRNQRS